MKANRIDQAKGLLGILQRNKNKIKRIFLNIKILNKLYLPLVKLRKYFLRMAWGPLRGEAEAKNRFRDFK